MLPMQISYWDYVEQKRHNLATEAAGFQQAQAALSQAESARKNVSVNQQNADTNRYNAEVNKQNADTNWFNALVNERNAQTNERNATTNERNAYVNERNAAVNERQASVREGELALDQKKFPYYVMDTQSSRMIAQAQQQNASTNAYNAATTRALGERSLEIQNHNAYTNEYNAKVNAKLTQQQARAQAIENQWAHVNNAAKLINTSSQSSYNYAKTMESVMNSIVGIPSNAISQILKLAK